MKKPRVWIVVVSAAIVIPLLLHLLNSSSGTSSRQGQSFVRRFRQMRIELQHARELDFLVTEIKVRQNRLFVDDFHARTILELDAQGNILRRFGNQGKGPGEIMRIAGWDVDDSMCYIADPTNLRVTAFALDGSGSTTRNIDRRFLAASRLNETQYLLFCPDWRSPKRSCFYVFDMVDSSYTRVDADFFDDYSGMQLAALLISNDQGLSVLAGYNFGYFLAIDRQGKLLYSKRTIDMTPPPDVLNAGGLQVLDPEAPETLVSGFADTDRLYLLSPVRAANEREPQNIAVDVYELRDGQYLYSFYIPMYDAEPPSAIAVDVANDRLIAYQGQTLVFYTIHADEF